MSAELSAIPTASPVIAEPAVPKKKTTLKVKKPVSPVPVKTKTIIESAEDGMVQYVRIVPDEDEKEVQAEEEMITIPKAEYERLLAIAEKAGEKVKKAPKGRVSTKDAVLSEMLQDGEKVFSPELVNTVSSIKGSDYILKMRATFVAETNGFVIRADDEAWNTKQMTQCLYEKQVSHAYKKRGHIASPTTLCSYFRLMMNHNGLSKQDKSTTCGFAKCYVKRGDNEIKLSQLL